MQPAWINLIFVAVRKRLIESEKSRNPSWLFDCHRSRARKIKKVANFANWLAPKKGSLFSLIYFFQSFSIYYIPHDYVTPQAMPHVIPQTHFSFYSIRSHQTSESANWPIVYLPCRKGAFIYCAGKSPVGNGLCEWRDWKVWIGNWNGFWRPPSPLPPPNPRSFQVIINESL